MSGHTPGPWESRFGGAIHGGEPLQKFGGLAIPQIALATLGESVTPEIQNANARLIAQAPVLLCDVKVLSGALLDCLSRLAPLMKSDPGNVIGAYLEMIRYAKETIGKVEGK